MSDPPARVARSTSDREDRNHLSVTGAPLCFTLSRYRSYECYAWQRFYRHVDYGEIGETLRGGTWGDPQAVDPMTDGYAYVYRREGSGWELWKVFTISSGQYQEVDARGDAVNYDASRGPARDHARIERYFPGEHGIPPEIVIVDSDIRLSEGRLRGQPYSLDRDPSRRGERFHLSRSRMRDASPNPPSGAEILETYRGGGRTPDLVTYDWKLEDFDGQPGVDIRRPHAFAEAERRNAVYRERVERHQTWLNDIDRNKEAYIHQTIVAVLRRDRGRESQLNTERMRQWKRDDTEQYRRHFFPVHYSVESLVSWLEDPLLREWLLDYNRSADDDEQEAGLGAYVTGILDLSVTARGRQYLEQQFRDDASFFNLATHVPEIRREYTDPAAHSNFAVEVRKVSNVLFAGLQEFGGLIVREGDATDTARRLAAWSNARGAQLALREGRTAQVTARALGHVDVDRLQRWATGAANFADSFKGRSIITCFEVLNLGIALKGVADAYRAEGGGNYHSNLFFSVLNAAGATADIAASGVLERYSRAVINRAGWASGRIYYLAIFSGMVDFVVGVRSVGQEWATGDYDTAVGWAVFSVGGAIVAVGGYMQLTGATVTVGSAGTAAIPGGAVILIGFLVEAIGLAWVWLANDDELDEYLMRSRFGRRPGFSSLDAEIEALNVLMCKFEVDAEFVSDRHVRLVIRPRLFTEDSVLELTRLASSAEARLIEYIAGDRGDIVTGGAGLGSATVRAGGSTRRTTITRSGGRITEIKVDIHGTQDIDVIRGNARLSIGPGGYLHGYETDFRIEAGIFDG